MSAGASLGFRNSRTSWKLSAEARAERFDDQDDLDLDEQALAAEASFASRKARVGFEGRAAFLAEPHDAETLEFQLLERSELSYAPELALGTGGAEVLLAYRGERVDFDEGAVAYLDHEFAGFETELRWGGRSRGQGFVRYSRGGVDYLTFDAAHPRYDFDRQRVLAGWRASSARRSSVELGLGHDRATSDEFAAGDQLMVTARMTQVMGEGGAVFQAAYLRGIEAAATADYKTASRLLLRFSNRANERLRWCAGLRSEISDYTNPDAAAASSLSVHALELGIERELGSPGAFRGRLYAAAGWETGDDFERLTVAGGVAFVR
jgi:hypothetical protein